MSTSWSVEIDVAVPAPRLFKAAVTDRHNLAPKIASTKIISVVPVEGDGSTMQFNFAPGLPFSFVKERHDFIDVEKCEVKTTMVEGGGIGIHVESASHHVKMEPKAGGSMVKVTGCHKPLPGVNAAQGAEWAKAAFSGYIKGVEEYLVANPDAVQLNLLVCFSPKGIGE